MNSIIVEIISIGNELLSGLTVNTNASWIARKLCKAGFTVGWITTISDHRVEIFDALSKAGERAHLVISTGGLGPTPDDLTKNSICDYFDDRLVLHAETLSHIKKLFEGRKLRMPSTNRQQAMVPENAIVIHNPFGTAPGLRMEKEKTVFYFVPGVPFEMKNMIENHILAEIHRQFKPVQPIQLLFRTTGIAESRLNELVSPVLKSFRNLNTAFLPKSSGVDLRITLPVHDKKTIIRLKQQLYDRLGVHLYTEEEKSLEEVVADLLLEKRLTLGIAESFTGGLIGDLFTDLPGSSAYFQGSAVTYSNDSKLRLLSVHADTLRTYGAVSEPTVTEMVRGVQSLFRTDCAIASTGIAGPTGATKEKPVGLCYLAAICGDRLENRQFVFGKDRRINKERGAFAAIELLRRLLI